MVLVEGVGSGVGSFEHPVIIKPPISRVASKSIVFFMVNSV
jgi:hypothetical protein